MMLPITGLLLNGLEVGHIEDYTNKETFQIILLDPAFYPTQTGDGEIICQYKIVSEPGSSYNWDREQ